MSTSSIHAPPPPPPAASGTGDSPMSVSCFLRAAKNAHKTRRTLIVRTGVKQSLLRRQIALAQNATRGAATVIESSLAIRLHATILCARRTQPVEVATNTQSASASQLHNGHHAAGGANAAGTGAIALTATAASREARVALLAELDAAPHGPVTPQAGQHNGQRAQPAPALRALVGATGTGIIDAGRPSAVVAVHVVVPGAVVEQRLGAAQTRGVVDDGLGAAQARLVAHPGLGQRTRTLALLAAAHAAAWTENRIGQRRITAEHNGRAQLASTAGSQRGLLMLLLQLLLQRMHVLLATAICCRCCWLLGNGLRYRLPRSSCRRCCCEAESVAGRRRWGRGKLRGGCFGVTI